MADSADEQLTPPIFCHGLFVADHHSPSVVATIVEKRVCLSGFECSTHGRGQEEAKWKKNLTQLLS